MCKNTYVFLNREVCPPPFFTECEFAMIRKLALHCAGLLKKEQNSELDEEEENFDEAVRAVNTVITHTR
jgi:hypothetical protein